MVGKGVVGNVTGVMNPISNVRFLQTCVSMAKEEVD